MNRLIDLLLAAAIGITVTIVSAHTQETSPEPGECPAAGIPADAEIETGLGAPPLAEVEAEVMMHIGPSFSCKRKYLIPAGGTVEVQGCEGAWCLVSYGNEVGYLPVAALDRVPDWAPDDPEE